MDPTVQKPSTGIATSVAPIVSMMCTPSPHIHTRATPIAARMSPRTRPWPSSRTNTRRKSFTRTSPTASPRMMSDADCEPEMPPVEMSSGT